jgi:hypothetical protein
MAPVLPSPGLHRPCLVCAAAAISASKLRWTSPSSAFAATLAADQSCWVNRPTTTPTAQRIPPACRIVSSAAASTTTANADNTRARQPGPRTILAVRTTPTAVSRKNNGSLSAEIDQANWVGRNNSATSPTSAGMRPSVDRTSRYSTTTAPR